MNAALLAGRPDPADSSVSLLPSCPVVVDGADGQDRQKRRDAVRWTGPWALRLFDLRQLDICAVNLRGEYGRGLPGQERQLARRYVMLFVGSAREADGTRQVAR